MEAAKAKEFRGYAATRIEFCIIYLCSECQWCMSVAVPASCSSVDSFLAQKVEVRMTAGMRIHDGRKVPRDVVRVTAFVV